MWLKDLRYSLICIAIYSVSLNVQANSKVMNEEAMKSFDQVIRLDQLRHANINEGRMAEQKSVVMFREQSRDKLAYWMAERQDQLAFLALSNVGFNFNLDGTPRVGSDFPYLEFAADVKPGTVNRTLRWDATNGLEKNFSSADIEAADTPSWAMIVEAKAYAKDNFVRPIRTKDGVEFYHLFMTPQGMAKLKQDPDYLANLRNAGPRGATNELFKGTDTVMVDGIAISEYRNVYHPSDWGASSDLLGQRALFCGAQALAMADIGTATWVEEGEDYENQQGISVGKIFGFLKPRFHANVTDSVEDFGCITIDTAT